MNFKNFSTEITNLFSRSNKMYPREKYCEVWQIFWCRSLLKSITKIMEERNEKVFQAYIPILHATSNLVMPVLLKFGRNVTSSSVSRKCFCSIVERKMNNWLRISSNFSTKTKTFGKGKFDFSYVKCTEWKRDLGMADLIEGRVWITTGKFISINFNSAHRVSRFLTSIE